MLYYTGDSHCTLNEFCTGSQDKGDEVDEKKSFVLKGDIKYSQATSTYTLINLFHGHLAVSNALSIFYTKENAADTESCDCQIANSLLFTVP